MAVILVDDSAPVVVTRTIVVTPEQRTTSTPTTPVVKPPIQATPIPVVLGTVYPGIRLNYSASDDPTQHQWYNAVEFTEDPYDGSVHGGLFTTNDNLTGNESNPPGISDLTGYRAAWWKYNCYNESTLDLTSVGSDGGIIATIYEVDAEGNWSLLSGGQSSSVHENVHLYPGTTYYLRIASTQNITQFYSFSGTVTLRITPGVIYPPPVKVRVRANLARPKQPHIDAVPLKVRLSLHASSVKVFSSPPIRVIIRHSAATTDLALTPSSPIPGEVVASNPPQLIVALTSTDDPDTGYTIEIQYDDNRAFSSPVTMSADIEVYEGGATFTPSAAVWPTTWWRARLLQNGQQILTWSIPRSFTISTTPDPADLTVTYRVDPLQDRPIHLWHLDPDGGEPGDEVTAYGQGFPATGTIVVGFTTANVLSWRLVPADPLAAPEPTIADDVVTPEHYEVLFEVPEIEEPGGSLSVEA